jgi:hypothetical protein
MLNEMTIPEAALRDENAVELLRAWVAERRLQCSSKLGRYQETKDIPEGRAWGVILADVTRHVAMAMEAAYSADRMQIVQEIRENYLKELGRRTADATGTSQRSTDPR